MGVRKYNADGLKPFTENNKNASKEISKAE